VGAVSFSVDNLYDNKGFFMQQNNQKTRRSFGNVFFIGLLSFFGGISQDMFVPVLPLYLSNILHFDSAFIGLSEGLVTAGASVFKVIAGYVSDALKKRKTLIFIGYACSLIARPLLAFVSSGAAILGLRFLDGAGKGIKDAPKSALIAASTVQSTRGRGFGIARALDTLGSVVGPLLLFALLYLLRGSVFQYHYILLFTAIPLFFTLGVLIFKVRQQAPAPKTQTRDSMTKLPRLFWIFLAITGVFALGNSTDAFLILRAQNVGVTLLSIPLVFALFNFIYAAASIPLGSLSDRIGREKVILVGWLAYALAYLGFGLANAPLSIWFLFAFYGIYYATTEGVASAFIADMVEESHRGTAYGIYNMAIGLLTLPASVIAGFLWDAISPAATFYFGSLMAFLAMLFLAALMWYRGKQFAFL